MVLFYYWLNEFKKCNPQTVRTKTKKKVVYNNALSLYNKLLSIYFNIKNGKKEEVDKKYNPSSLFIKGYKFIDSQKEDEEKRIWKYDDSDEFIGIPDMPPLEGDEEVKEAKWLNILTPNKLLTRLPILLAQIKSRKIFIQIKKEIRKILHLLYQHNKITKKLDNNFIKSL